MPSALFAKLGIKQTTAFGIHMAMYGTPTLYFIQNYLLNDLPVHFQRYVFSDWPFLTSLTLLVLLDTIVGGIGALLNRVWNEEKQKFESEFSGRTLYKKLGTKTFGITVYVISIGILKNTVIDGEQNLLSDLVDSGFYSVMIGFELASILRNTYKIYPFDVLKWALAKLEVFYDKRTDRVKTNNEE